MPTHVADVPKPMYAWVKDEFLYDHQDGHGYLTECMIYGISSIPGRAWGMSALMKNGGVVQHLPVHSFVKDNAFNCKHDLDDLQVWSCYGWEFSTHVYGALEEMPVQVYMKKTGTYVTGRYWFTAAPYGDHYSATPDQHKHFNFIWLDCGCLAAMPGNRVQFFDSSFVELPQERPRYIVNTRYWFPEKIESGSPFDKIISSHTG